MEREERKVLGFTFYKNGYPTAIRVSYDANEKVYIIRADGGGEAGSGYIYRSSSFCVYAVEALEAFQKLIQEVLREN